MINLDNNRIHRKDVKVINKKIETDSTEFMPDYHGIMHILDNLFEIDEEDKLQRHLGHKLLRHRALKSDPDDDDVNENDNASKWNMAV